MSGKGGLGGEWGEGVRKSWVGRGVMVGWGEG